MLETLEKPISTSEVHKSSTAINQGKTEMGKPMKYATKLEDSFVNHYEGKTPPWGPVGYITYKRTYARYLDGKGRSEEWWETVRRCCNGLIEIGGAFTPEEIEDLYDKVYHLKCSFSGRALWQLGTKTVQRIGGDSLQNCWHVAVDHPIDPFCFTFTELMLGGGVGLVDDITLGSAWSDVAVPEPGSLLLLLIGLAGLGFYRNRRRPRR